jgi:ferredoxin
MGMKLHLDSAKCEAHGLCYSRAPQLFDSDDEGKAVLIEADPSEKDRNFAELCVQTCPEGAITLTEG